MYKIVGGDQREYGPVTSEQVREWISTGRANAQTLASFEGSPWKPLSSFPEFADALRVSTPPPIPQSGYAGQTAPGYGGLKTNTLAVSGLVLSILGFCCSPLALAGLVLSVVGFVQINKNPELFSTSKVVPILGIVLSVIAIVLNIILLASGAFTEVLRNLPR